MTMMSKEKKDEKRRPDGTTPHPSVGIGRVTAFASDRSLLAISRFGSLWSDSAANLQHRSRVDLFNQRVDGAVQSTSRWRHFDALMRQRAALKRRRPHQPTRQPHHFTNQGDGIVVLPRSWVPPCTATSGVSFHAAGSIWGWRQGSCSPC